MEEAEAAEPVGADAHTRWTTQPRVVLSQSEPLRFGRAFGFKVSNSVRRMTRLIAFHARPIVNMISITLFSILLLCAIESSTHNRNVRT